ncbi:MAG: DUF2156 domain-containing protein [Deltaproteobacteria bacterium]|nr:DUF2156 domain-containing protein [Deltaproteobacteria bacterium]
MPLQFEPVSIDKQDRYINRLAACPGKTSDYSFVNIWAWGQEYGLSWAWDDRLVWLKQTEPEETLWAPIGPWEDIDWKQTFSDHPKTENIFIRVPEKLANLWKQTLGAQVQLEEIRGHWDYLYDVSELKTLKGKRFHKKKNLLNQFIKKNNFSYAPLGPDQIDKALAMQENWCTWRDCESLDTLAAENRSIQRVLTDWETMTGLSGGTLTVEGQMVAYTVAEQVSEDTILIHFEKANQDFKGAYQAINQQFLLNTGDNYRFVNREQDLGDEGLRKAKLSYHPVDFLKKYHAVISI